MSRPTFGIICHGGRIAVKLVMIVGDSRRKLFEASLILSAPRWHSSVGDFLCERTRKNHNNDEPRTEQYHFFQHAELRLFGRLI